MKHYKVMASHILALGFYVGCAHAHTEIIEFSDSRIIIEINATDGDSGIQMFVDGEGWDWLFGTGELTHNFPAGPELVLPAEDSVVAPGAVTVMWNPVTTQFGGEPLDGDIVGYQVIVEQEEPVLRVFSADVTADVTSIVIPPSFMRSGVDYKFEVLAIEASGNQTLSEREFSTVE